MEYVRPLFRNLVKHDRMNVGYDLSCLMLDTIKFQENILYQSGVVETKRVRQIKKKYQTTRR